MHADACAKIWRMWKLLRGNILSETHSFLIDIYVKDRAQSFLVLSVGLNASGLSGSCINVQPSAGGFSPLNSSSSIVCTSLMLSACADEADFSRVLQTRSSHCRQFR